jgi:hypothetical protein
MAALAQPEVWDALPEDAPDWLPDCAPTYLSPVEIAEAERWYRRSVEQLPDYEVEVELEVWTRRLRELHATGQTLGIFTHDSVARQLEDRPRWLSQELRRRHELGGYRAPQRWDDQFVATLKAQIDLREYLTHYGFLDLQKSADRLIGLCPLHSEDTPSFTVYRDHYHCFGCNATGDVFAFEQAARGVATFPEAVRQVAQAVGVAIPEVRQGTPMLAVSAHG